MKKGQFALNRGIRISFLLLILTVCSSSNNRISEQKSNPVLQYTVSMPEPSNHYYHIELYCRGWIKDTIDFKMPKWTPGYYQIMDYAKEVTNFSAKDKNGNAISVKSPNDNTWQITVEKRTPFKVNYDVKADRKFVANNYLDSTHGYIVPAGAFLYIKEHINTPVSVKLIINKQWSRIATGLDPVPGKTNEFFASDFDMLYDCPILAGNLEELPPFKINGIEHRFIGYKLGSFDKEKFIANLTKIVQAGVEIFGDIPYKQYTFIGIGPGYGGIEHLNNTTVSFNGNGLDKKESMNRMMSFLAHEYFHNFNVKCIRPYELGPFDYDKENKTNLLWVSEGLTVYYEYLIVKRAGLISEQNFFGNFESSINAYENNPGRSYQSLTQASFNTWSDGPFGKQGEDADKSISYYDKGPVIGLILDFAIRHATQNKKSLDDVMRLLYWHYYKELQRGFTDAEFQQVCESVAGISLIPEFEYINTTKEIDYATYLSYAGLKIGVETNKENGNRKFTISRLDTLNSIQYNILQTWQGK
ncbi:MAG: M61 family peptidase [Bacteroidia bacterium]|nr:M61 family peptidase [Bacteroidia bacterium]